MLVWVAVTSLLLVVDPFSASSAIRTILILPLDKGRSVNVQTSAGNKLGNVL